MTTQAKEHRPPMNVMNAAIYCGLPQGYLNKLRVSGGGPTFIRIGEKGGTILYSPDDLDEWLNSKKYQNTSQYER